MKEIEKNGGRIDAIFHAPYLKEIPCDPVTKNPYFYIPNGCSEFRLYTTLADVHDKDIIALGCDDGCGLDGDGNGQGDSNYGAGSSNIDIGTTFIQGLCGGCPLPGNGACCPGGYVCDSNMQYCLK